MNSHPVPIVLAIGDLGLRTVLTARLGMAGEIPISAADHRDPTFDRRVRASALLIIEAALIQSAAQHWGEWLREERWSGKVIIIVDDEPPPIDHEGDITLVSRRNADIGVLALLQLWRSRESAPPAALAHPTEPG